MRSRVEVHVESPERSVRLRYEPEWVKHVRQTRGGGARGDVLCLLVGVGDLLGVHSRSEEEHQGGDSDEEESDIKVLHKDILR